MFKFLKNNIYLILTIVLSIPAVAALLHFGFYGASDDLHIAWLFEMDKILKVWQIPPRYVADLSFGFGYPLFNFVFPLPFYIGEIFHSLGLTFVDSVKSVFGISLIVSGVMMYIFLKELISSELSLAGALIYVYTPYRSTDVYIRGAFGEALSFVFLPLILYAVVKLYKAASSGFKVEWKYTSILSLSLGALVLSHDIVSYMFFPFVILFIFLLAFSKKEFLKSFVVNNILGVVGGLLISIYFWLPALIDSKLMAYSTVFDFKDHYPTLKQLITPYFGYGASVPGPYDGMSFFLGALNIFVIAVGTVLAVLFWKKIRTSEKFILGWAMCAFLVAIFMMNFRSTFLWNILPFVPYFQFPWRFLTLTTFVSVIFLIPFNYLSQTYLVKCAAGLMVIAVLLLNYKYFSPHDFLGRVDDYYMNRYIPVPVASSAYLETQEEYLRLPKETKKRPDKNYPSVFSDEKFLYTVIYTDGIYSKITVSVGADQVISYNKYNFPGWVAKIDGKDTDIVSGHPFGQISIKVPQGEHVLEFGYKETLRNIVLGLFSLTALLGSVFFLFRKTK